MEFIQDFEKVNNQYASKIKESLFIEGKKKAIDIKGSKDICEVIIGNNLIEYQTLDDNMKNQFIVDKKLSFASSINIFSKDKSKNPFIRKWNLKLIQTGLQNQNYLSSIIYLNEFFKINTIIYNEDNKKFYKTTYKNYEPLYCVYKNNSWFLMDPPKDKENMVFSDIKELDKILTFDIDTLMIYKPYLDSLSKYKLKELEDLAKNFDIPLTTQAGKKKLKKDLYDEINLKQYIQDI